MRWIVQTGMWCVGFFFIWFGLGFLTAHTIWRGLWLGQLDRMVLMIELAGSFSRCARSLAEGAFEEMEAESKRLSS